MATTFTQDDINAVAQQVLTLIRDSGREFNNNPITFKDPFNVTEEEREGIRIPAIDERTAGQSKTGTLDLEALLAAYGVSHVEEIASDISSNYMKKVADSDLDMNGNDIMNPISIQSQVLGFNRTVIIPVPRISYDNLGVASGDLDNFFKAYFKKIAELYPTKRRTLFIGTLNVSGWSNAMIYIHDCSDLASNGVPKYATCMTHSYLDADYIVKTDTNGNIIANKISQYSATDTSKDNRINAFGSNYIRYENGLQICWGAIDLGTIDIETVVGSLYRETITTSISYGASFSTTPSVMVHNNGGNAWTAKVSCSTTSINQITLYGSVISEYSVGLSYIAIGRWK